MAIRTLTYALAAAGMTLGATATAASAAPLPDRSGSAIGDAEQIGGNAGLIAVLVGIAAILSIIIFDGDDYDDDIPVSP